MLRAEDVLHRGPGQQKPAWRLLLRPVQHRKSLHPLRASNPLLLEMLHMLRH